MNTLSNRRDRTMTRRSVLAAVAAGLGLALAIVAGAQAHGGGEATALSVEPDSLQPGGTIVLVGKGLEPNSDRTLVLAGPGMTVDLGTVTTDADGMFQIQLTIPSHMPAGAYELRAIGDEILTVPIALTAGEGSAAGAGSAPEAVVPHQRHALEFGILAAAVLTLLAVGGLLIRFAERFGRPAVATETVPATES